MSITEVPTGTFQFAYYVVGPEVFRLVTTNAPPFAIGSMYGQGSATPNFSAASLTGSFVFGQAWPLRQRAWLRNSRSIYQDPTAGLHGWLLTTNSSGGMPVAAGDGWSTYMVKVDGYGAIALPGTTTDGLANFGVYLVDPALNIADPNNTSGGGGAVLVDLDTNTFGEGTVGP